MSTSITTDVSNYGAQGHGDLSHRMKALTWQGKNSVKVGQSSSAHHDLHLSCVSQHTLILFAHTICDSGDRLPADHR